VRAINKYTFIGLVLILVSMGARADFVSGEFELEATCFEAVFANYDFKNNWAETVTYKLTATGDGAEWVNVNGKWIAKEPLVFTLGPGESKILYAYFKPCCWTKPGDYIIGLQYSSKKGVKTRNITLTVLESRDIELIVTPEKLVLGQCQAGEFEIKVRNNSRIGETIQLGTSGLDSEWLELGSEEFYLEDGGERIVQLSVVPGCTEALKEYPGKITAKIKNTELSTSEDIYVEITDKQALALRGDTDTGFEACNDLVEEATLYVKNNGRAKDTLTLSIDGPNWVELKEKALILNAGEEEGVTITFNSGDIVEKEYSFTLKAFSETYEKETAADFKVNVRDCFKLQVEKAEGAAEACLEDSLSYAFDVKNLKDTEIAVKIGVSGLDGSVSPNSFVLDAGKEQGVEVNFSLSGETAGNKTFTLQVEGDNFEFSKKYSVLLNDCFAIELYNEELCQQIDAEVGPQICPQEKIITSTVKNTGTKSQVVTLKVSGEDWVLIEPKELSLNPGEEREFYAYFVPPVSTEEGTYTAIVEATGEDFYEKTVMKIKVTSLGAQEVIDVLAETEIEEEIIETKRTVKSKIHLKNSGNCTLEVTGITAQGFTVEFSETEFSLEIGEEKTIIATIYLGELTEAEEISLPISIQTNRGIIKKQLTVSLTEETAVVEEVIEEGETVEAAEKRTVTARINLKNTEDSKLSILGITAEGFDVIFDPGVFELDVNGEQAITATVTLPDGYSEDRASIPITIETDKGQIKETLDIDLTEADQGAMPAGFIGLAGNTVNLVVLLFLGIVAIVIVMLAWHAYKKPQHQKKKAK